MAGKVSGPKTAKTTSGQIEVRRRCGVANRNSTLDCCGMLLLEQFEVEVVRMLTGRLDCFARDMLQKHAFVERIKKVRPTHRTPSTKNDSVRELC